MNIPLTSPSKSLSMDDDVDDDEIGGTVIITTTIIIIIIITHREIYSDSVAKKCCRALYKK